MIRAKGFLILAAALALCACREELSPRRPPATKIVWHEVGAWSGHASSQTDSFDLSVLEWRIAWKASSQDGRGGGSFKVTVNSAVSGRPLQVPVDRKSPGSGVAYVSDDPRLYYLVIDSTGMDWTVTVEQPIQVPRSE